MHQLLKHLIILLALIPSFFCFSSAQKTETGKTNPVQPLNLPASLPPALREIQSVELLPEAGAWAVQIKTGGGFAGKGKGDLMITSKGYLYWDAAENQCQVKLQNDSIQMLTRTAISADASSWSGTTGTICADCYFYALVLQRREPDGSERRYIAYWDDSTAGKISEDARKVYETFMTFKGCKQ